MSGSDTALQDFVRRAVVDCLLQALPETWERRAAVLDDAAPRPDDYHGKASREELSEAWRRCHRDAKRCRDHAQLLRSCRSEAWRDTFTHIVDQEAA